jgi:hypothetical protein
MTALFEAYRMAPKFHLNDSSGGNINDFAALLSLIIV